MKKYSIFLTLFFGIISLKSFAQDPIQIKGVFPQMTVKSGYKDRSEAGIGALIPWADKLWAVGYVAHIKGTGVGLYEISENMTMKKHPLSYTGTYANRHIHKHLLDLMPLTLWEMLE
jgi:hypothetical protein